MISLLQAAIWSTKAAKLIAGNGMPMYISLRESSGISMIEENTMPYVPNIILHTC